MSRLKGVLERGWRELKQNRRLQIGAIAVAVLLCVEGGLAWRDRLAAKEQQLRQVGGELRTLRAQSRAEAALRQARDDMALSRMELESRLWTVSSEAVGQARLKDWLKTIATNAKVIGPNLALAAAKPREEEAPTEGTDTAGAGTGTEPGGEKKARLYEMRATLSLPFSPEILEHVLADIEGGAALASVESLTVSRRDRRIELTVCVLTRVGGGTKE